MIGAPAPELRIARRRVGGQVMTGGADATVTCGIDITLRRIETKDRHITEGIAVDNGCAEILHNEVKIISHFDVIDSNNKHITKCIRRNSSC